MKPGSAAVPPALHVQTATRGAVSQLIYLALSGGGGGRGRIKAEASATPTEALREACQAVIRASPLQESITQVLSIHLPQPQGAGGSFPTNHPGVLCHLLVLFFLRPDTSRSGPCLWLPGLGQGRMTRPRYRQELPREQYFPQTTCCPSACPRPDSDPRCSCQSLSWSWPRGQASREGGQLCSPSPPLNANSGFQAMAAVRPLGPSEKQQRTKIYTF